MLFIDTSDDRLVAIMENEVRHMELAVIDNGLIQHLLGQAYCFCLKLDEDERGEIGTINDGIRTLVAKWHFDGDKRGGVTILRDKAV